MTARRTTARRLALVLALPVAATACSSELPPTGEVMIVVDTDLPVPAAAGRLRVDLYAQDGTWYESRDVALREPSDWPASFGVLARDGAERSVLVRLRAYPEDMVRDYRGERFVARPPYQPPAVARTVAELCAAPPQLPIGGTVTLRQGRDPFIGTLLGGNCEADEPAIGSTAAAVDIAQPGAYRFAVLAAAPPEARSTLQLRRACDDGASWLACSTGVVENGIHYSARFEVELEPGRYFMVSSGSYALEAPADIVIGAWEASAPPPPYPPAAPLPLAEEPRLAGAGISTPAAEPLPSATVDRLLLVRIQPDAVLSTRVTLRAACLGTMAQLGSEPPHQHPSMDSASTCIDSERTLEPLRESGLGPVTDLGPSAQGTFFAPQLCAPVDAPAEKVCVPGGFFVLGSRVTVTGDGDSSIPERAMFISRLVMDKHEVTVARYREALAMGFDPGADRPKANEGALSQTVKSFTAKDLCTWSEEPRGREDMALTCLSWYAARDYCHFVGGDLPTEAQWEYVATAAGRQHETMFPWGNDEARCDCTGIPFPCHQPVYGRSDFDKAVGLCYLQTPSSVGPLPVTASEGPTGDVTPALDGFNGVVGLAGGVREWVREGFRRYSHPCWEAAPLIDPGCQEDEAPLRVARGGDWILGQQQTFVTWRFSVRAQTTDVVTGFRCAYPAP